MKKFALIFGLLSLSACTLPASQPPAGPLDIPPPTLPYDDAAIQPAPIPAASIETRLRQAETAYNLASLAYIAAASTGQLTPATKATLQTILGNVYSALRTARVAACYLGTTPDANCVPNEAAFSAALDYLYATRDEANKRLPPPK